MSQLLPLLGVLAVFFLLIGLAWLAAWKLGLLKPALARKAPTPRPEPNPRLEPDAEPEPESADVPTPYRRCDRLLSPMEASFHSTLRLVLPQIAKAMGQAQPPLLFAKVRLLDVIDVDRQALGKTSETSARNRIDRRHLDFLLCDPQDTRPLLAIELDDSSHQRGGRKTKDEFLDRSCAAAGLAILRVRGAAGFVPERLVQQVAERIAARGHL